MEDEIKKVLIENLFACTESKDQTKEDIIRRKGNGKELVKDL